MSSVYVCDQVLNTCSAQIHNPYDFFTLNWQQICSCEPKIVVQTLVVVNVIYIFVYCMHPSCCKCTMSQKWNEIALNLTIVASRHLTMNNISNVSMHMHKPRLLTEIYTSIDIFIFKICVWWMNWCVRARLTNRLMNQFLFVCAKWNNLCFFYYRFVRMEILCAVISMHYKNCPFHLNSF